MSTSSTDDAAELIAIGEVSRRSGRPASTIRYYEEIGLLPEPVRVGAARRYRPEVVRTLAIIETAQRAGLDLGEVRLLLGAAADSDAIDRLRLVAARKLPELVASIERAEIVRGWLEDAARCRCPTLDDCPLFDEPRSLPERRHALR